MDRARPRKGGSLFIRVWTFRASGGVFSFEEGFVRLFCAVFFSWNTRSCSGKIVTRDIEKLFQRA